MQFGVNGHPDWWCEQTDSRALSHRALTSCPGVVTDRAAGRLTPVRQAQPSAVIDAARAFSARVYRSRAHAAHPSVGLTIDPDNELATNSVKLIEDIYASMGWPVPQAA